MNVAVVGALGAVGREMIRILEERNFPLERLIPLDLPEHEGRELSFRGRPQRVEVAREGAFRGADLAFFSAGGEASLKLAPLARREGCLVIDNSNAWRMDAQVPLIIAEVNPEAARSHQGLIANPNCSTIQMLIALAPLHRHFHVERLIVSTYQAVSGAGQTAVDELIGQAKDFVSGRPCRKEVFPQQIFMNLIPQIDVMQSDGYTLEEKKMRQETHKILDPSIKVHATAVRVPVLRCHSESIYLVFKEDADLGEVRRVLALAEGLCCMENGELPQPLPLKGRDEVYLGRLRQDPDDKRAISFWLVADNLRKGAALNAVQIGELLLRRNWLHAWKTERNGKERDLR